jgi:acyl-CoA hydrolase
VKPPAPREPTTIMSASAAALSSSSAGGQAIIALPSWHPKADVSTVAARLDGPVTSLQHSYIVSDQGTAAVWGHDTSGEAAEIIGNVAREAGRDLGLRV